MHLPSGELRERSGFTQWASLVIQIEIIAGVGIRKGLRTYVEA